LPTPELCSYALADRHGIFRISAKEMVEGDGLTEFGRACGATRRCAPENSRCAGKNDGAGRWSLSRGSVLSCIAVCRRQRFRVPLWLRSTGWLRRFARRQGGNPTFFIALAQQSGQNYGSRRPTWNLPGVDYPVGPIRRPAPWPIRRQVRPKDDLHVFVASGRRRASSESHIDIPDPPCRLQGSLSRAIGRHGCHSDRNRVDLDTARDDRG